MENYSRVSASIVVVLVLGFCVTVRAACLQNESNGLESSLASTEEVNCCIGYRKVTGERRCEVCPVWQYGDACKQRCRCVRENTRVCEHVTGSCRCRHNWSGATCAQRVVRHKRSEEEAKAFPGIAAPTDPCGLCVSANTAKCVTSCECNPGYTGILCNTECPSGLFGQGCSSNCTCHVNNTASCNSVTGYCTCAPGYDQPDCTQECPSGLFGQGCASNCTCHVNNTASCNPVTGYCTCAPGYDQSDCTKECPSGLFGQGCASNCTCHVNNTASCNPVTGYCTCAPGYDQLDCKQDCPAMKYGDQCAQTCNCPSSAYNLCDHLAGACTCKPGYLGDTCQTVCPENTFGVKCLGTCDCVAGRYSSCNRETGACVCDSGWQGTRCDAAVVATTASFLEIPGVIGGIGFVATLVLSLVILFILWFACGCSCYEFRHRSRGREQQMKLLESQMGNKNGAGMMGMAAVTTGTTKPGTVTDIPADNDGVYYGRDTLASARDPAGPSGQVAPRKPGFVAHPQYGNIGQPPQDDYENLAPDSRADSGTYADLN